MEKEKKIKINNKYVLTSIKVDNYRQKVNENGIKIKGNSYEGPHPLTLPYI